MSQELVSVIVPVYKVENYLRKCVDSIIRQTYKNLEIILVDDGSPDGCPKICDDYAVIDSRIRVIHKTNGGLSDARNAGIEVATGEWIAFIDSDDWVDDRFIATLLEAAITTDSDLAICAYSKVYENGTTIPAVNGEQEKILSSLEAIRDLFTRRTYGGVMSWNKLYKRNIFIDNGIEFPYGKVHEDNFTTYKTYFFANKIVYIDTPLVFYLQRRDSIMGEQFSDKRLDAIEAAVDARKFIESRKISLSEEADYMVMTAYMNVLYYLGKSNNRSEFLELEKQLLDKLLLLRKTMRYNRYMRSRDRLRLILANLPWAYTPVMKLLKR